MSDNENETGTAPEPEPENVPEPEPEPEANPDAEPFEPIEGDDEQDEQGDEKLRQDEQTASVLDVKARKKRDERLDGEKIRHLERIQTIMGPEAESLIPCPVCMDGIDGLIFEPEVQQLSPEAISRIRQVIGLPDYSTFRQATDALACPDCDGLGEVVTGSHVPGYETKTCGRCGKKGWVGTGERPSNGHVEAEDEPIVTGPTVFFADNEDPEIRHLRERGFTVIPPMTVSNS